MFRQVRRRSLFICAIVLLGMSPTVQGQDSAGAKPAPPPASRGGLGVDIFGGAGVSWPGAKASFEAVELRPRPIDLGGGARVTGLWSDMFIQLSGAHWRDTGERVFVDSDGTAFRLGIPLDVNATFLDGTLGFKRALSRARKPNFFYLGVGAGVVRYSENSPFADAGEDLEVSELSYHALGAC